MNVEKTAGNSDLLDKAQALALSDAEVLLKTMPKLDMPRRNVGGRPRGSFSRRENPLKRELHKEGLAIIKACIAAAKGGDVSAQRLLIDRLLPHGANHENQAAARADKRRRRGSIEHYS